MDSPNPRDITADPNSQRFMDLAMGMEDDDAPNCPPNDNNDLNSTFGELAFGSNSKAHRYKYESNIIIEHSDSIPDQNSESPIRKKGSKSKSKRKSSKKSDHSILPFSKYIPIEGIVQYLKAIGKLLIDEANCRSGITFVMVGLILAFLCELYQNSPRYNVFFLLTILVAAHFPHFPSKSVRPQISLAVLTALSVAVDLIYIVTIQSSQTSTALRALICIILISKCIAVGLFIKHASGTRKARKYLIRRLRLFFIPLIEPRRLKREIRSRILAIGFLQLAAFVLYTTLFALSLSVFSYFAVAVRPSNGLPLSISLLVKLISTTLVMLGVLYDTDIVLTLAHFGCLGCNMSYVKEYTRRKKEEYGGWPYPFAYNDMRFQLLTALKAVDFVIGILVWISISQTFGKEFASLSTDLYGYVSVVIITLISSDIWCPVLFCGVFWLIKRVRKLEEDDLLDSSDDSELDELEVRTPLTRAEQQKRDEKQVEKMKRRRRKKENKHLKLAKRGRFADELSRHNVRKRQKSKKDGDEKDDEDDDDIDRGSSGSDDSSSESSSQSSDESNEGDNNHANNSVQADSSSPYTPVSKAMSPASFESRMEMFHEELEEEEEEEVDERFKPARSLRERFIAAAGSIMRRSPKLPSKKHHSASKVQSPLGWRAQSSLPRGQIYDIDGESMGEVEVHFDDDDYGEYDLEANSPAYGSPVVRRRHNYYEEPGREGRVNVGQSTQSLGGISLHLEDDYGDDKGQGDGEGENSNEDAEFSNAEEKARVSSRRHAPAPPAPPAPPAAAAAAAARQTQQTSEDSSSSSSNSDFDGAAVRGVPRRRIDQTSVRPLAARSMSANGQGGLGLIDAAAAAVAATARESAEQQQQQQQQQQQRLMTPSNGTRASDAGSYSGSSLRSRKSSQSDTKRSVSSAEGMHSRPQGDGGYLGSRDSSPILYSNGKSKFTMSASPYKSEIADSGDAVSSAGRPRQIKRPRPEEGSMVLEPNVKIDPLAFTRMWDKLAPVAVFNCRVQSLQQPACSMEGGLPLDVEMLTSHLRRMGFFIVAAGLHADGQYKMYLFASGFIFSSKTSDVEEYLKPNYYLAELRVSAIGDQSSLDHSTADSSTMSLQCVSKCKDKSLCGLFVAELNLGTVMYLVGR